MQRIVTSFRIHHRQVAVPVLTSLFPHTQVLAPSCYRQVTTATLQQPSSDRAPSARGRIILTDAMALLYKSHFAFPPGRRLHDDAGNDTTVLFGFLSMLFNIMDVDPMPTHFAVVLDAAGKNFRHEIYPGYKGQRPDTPTEVKSAIAPLMELLVAMGVPVIRVPGVEADDVIGTLATRSIKAGLTVGIASPDKDFFQLLQPGLLLLRPPKKVEGATKPPVDALRPYTEEHFKQEFELTPLQFIDMLALSGDSSDNVPGVAGIGPKRATALLKQYGTLANLLDNIETVEAPRLRDSLTQGVAAARLSQQLVSIRTDLDLPPVLVPLDEFLLRPPVDGGKAAISLMADLQLKTQITRFQQHLDKLARHAKV